MAEVVDISEAKKGGTKMSKKPSIKELETRLAMMENLVGQLQGVIQSFSNELFQTNANGVTLFRALEKKEILTESDIEESWEENIVKPYEEAEKAKDEEEPAIIT